MRAADLSALSCQPRIKRTFKAFIDNNVKPAWKPATVVLESRAIFPHVQKSLQGRQIIYNVVTA